MTAFGIPSVNARPGLVSGNIMMTLLLLVSGVMVALRRWAVDVVV